MNLLSSSKWSVLKTYIRIYTDQTVFSNIYICTNTYMPVTKIN